jgi:hypothetical protein
MFILRIDAIANRLNNFSNWDNIVTLSYNFCKHKIIIRYIEASFTQV